MTTITGHYNVTVNSRYYAFLQDGMESAEPHVLMETVEKKRELLKENKTKMKKEKRNKQLAEAIKENFKAESNLEENSKVEIETVEPKQEPIEKSSENIDIVTEDKNIEIKSERSNRGRTNSRRQNGGPRRGGFPRNDERAHNNDDRNQPKSPTDGGYSRPSANNRGRPFRKERFEGDNYNKVGYFEDQSSSTNRGNPSRRRPSGRPSSRYNRGSDRNAFDRNSNDRNPVSDINSTDRNPNDRYTTDRGSNERTGYDRPKNERSYRSDNDDSLRTDIIPKTMGTFEDMSTRPARSSRGRYPRANRGSFNRYSGPPQDNDNEFENNRIGYFEENTENREYRGNRGGGGSGGRFRGGRGMRRGRGDFWRPRPNDRNENSEDGFTNNMKTENQDVPISEKWPDVDEEMDMDQPQQIQQKPVNGDSHGNDANIAEADFNDMKKSNWGEIVDDPPESKTSVEHMTLEEWKALHGKDRLINQEGKENRKANDGQDVFSGMEEYRKGRVNEEQPDEHDVHETQHGRQKQSIPVSIRFSRNTEYGGDSNNFEPLNIESRNFSRGGDGGNIGGSGGGNYYKNDSKFRGENSASGRGGRSRGAGGGNSDFNTYGRGRDFNRGRGRFNRNSYPVKRKEEQVDGVSINLGNEDEFPTLS